MPERVDIQNVLSQMRAMKLQVQNASDLVRLDHAERIKLGSITSERNFHEMMADALNTVNDLGKESGRLSDALERGVEGVTITQAMIASQKASIAFQAVTQVRNKLVTAYEKIMNMPI